MWAEHNRGSFTRRLAIQRWGTVGKQFWERKVIIVNQPVVSQSEADALAARLNEISRAFIEAEGTAYRCPD
jgi:hypothetical protein